MQKLTPEQTNAYGVNAQTKIGLASNFYNKVSAYDDDKGGYVATYVQDTGKIAGTENGKVMKVYRVEYPDKTVKFVRAPTYTGSKDFGAEEKDEFAKKIIATSRGN